MTDSRIAAMTFQLKGIAACKIPDGHDVIVGHDTPEWVVRKGAPFLAAAWKRMFLHPSVNALKELISQWRLQHM